MKKLQFQTFQWLQYQLYFVKCMNIVSSMDLQVPDLLDDLGKMLHGSHWLMAKGFDIQNTCEFLVAITYTVYIIFTNYSLHIKIKRL